MDDVALSHHALPVPSKPTPQPRLHRLFQRLSALCPNVAIRVDVEDGGRFALELFTYDRPAAHVTNPLLDLKDIKRVVFPHFDGGRVYFGPEPLLKLWVLRAEAAKTEGVRRRRRAT